ncbi:MAG: hypothetical protein ACD_83C00254G0003 [uncultured bacterium]|uniref:Pentapeptide repeat protein n=1 Tax=Berkelbacteria bacterium GW2011_GWA2_38_9 TaxID=1618334 RepID=A0A0G0L7X8_9BACT|nr:MAG: hypothetical protein ACD_83C00254G0003 [uncultured bacterium]KKQ88088.1 MAG: hypothetical protein UT11_C0040G0005 [Berkelbacteria bacterium GW2011_GWA2_38_9]
MKGDTNLTREETIERLKSLGYPIVLNENGYLVCTGYNFSNQDLRDLNFGGCDLGVADFSGADLRGTNFTGAYLRQATFSDTKLEGSCFLYTNLWLVHVRANSPEEADIDAWIMKMIRSILRFPRKISGLDHGD